MKVIKKLKALFIKDERPIYLDLSAAEIKEGRAYLHPKGEKKVTYLVKSDEIEIRLSKGRSLTDKDILRVGERKKKEEKRDKAIEKKTEEKTKKDLNPKANDPGTVVYDLTRFKKKTFSVSLYPEEYEALMEAIQKYGYKRSEFILASAQTATQGTMARAQKKVVMARKEIRKEEKEMKLKTKE